MTQATNKMLCSTVGFWKKWCVILNGAGNFTFMKILVLELLLEIGKFHFSFLRGESKSPATFENCNI